MVRFSGEFFTQGHALSHHEDIPHLWRLIFFARRNALFCSVATCKSASDADASFSACFLKDWNFFHPAATSREIRRHVVFGKHVRFPFGNFFYRALGILLSHMQCQDDASIPPCILRSPVIRVLIPPRSWTSFMPLSSYFLSQCLRTSTETRTDLPVGIFPRYANSDLRDLKKIPWRRILTWDLSVSPCSNSLPTVRRQTRLLSSLRSFIPNFHDQSSSQFPR